MSLIGDALKKAHLEAVRQDGGTSRMVHTPGVAQYRRARPGERKGWMTALVVTNVLLAMIITAAILWFSSGDSDSATAGPVAAEQVLATPQSPASKDEQPSIPRPSEPLPAATVAKEEPPPPEARTAESVAPPVHRAESVKLPVSPRNDPEPAVQAAAEPLPPAPVPVTRSRNGFVDGQTYMRSVPVPGGSELVINGVSVAGNRGVALINGRMIREGDRVGPFTVGTIADRRVQLHYEGISIYLKLP